VGILKPLLSSLTEAPQIYGSALPTRIPNPVVFDVAVLEQFLYSIWTFLGLRIFHGRADSPPVFACNIVAVFNSQSGQKDNERILAGRDLDTRSG
jgi:hypothetical protein